MVSFSSLYDMKSEQALSTTPKQQESAVSTTTDQAMAVTTAGEHQFNEGGRMISRNLLLTIYNMMF